MINILLVGCGNMGGAMARAWQQQNIPFNILTPSANLDGVTPYRNVDDIKEKQDIIILGFKPYHIDSILPTLKPLMHEATTIVSVLAGVMVETLQDTSGCDAIVRTMPNTPCSIGEGVTGAYATDSVQHKDTIAELLKALGTFYWVDTESDIDRVTAISGSGPAYIFHFAEAMINAGVKLGLSKELATNLSIGTIKGAALLMEQSKTPPGVLRENVTSPNGTTAAALSAFMDESNGLKPLCIEATKRAHNRAQELARKD